MTLDDDVIRLEFSGFRDAKLFYSTVKSILAKAGFSHSSRHYYCIDGKYVGVRRDFESFSRFLNKNVSLKNIKFVEVFSVNDLLEVRALTGYASADDLRGNNFSYYVIGSNSNLGSKLPGKVRDGVLDVDKRQVAKLDFNEGFITNMGGYHFFTLLSLYCTVNDCMPVFDKFVLKSHFEFKC